MSIVFVCNKGDKEFADRFDGMDFVFPKGETVPVPRLAAVHFFGYGLDDKKKAFVRQGVMRDSTQYSKGMDWLGQFAFAEPDEVTVPDLGADALPSKPKQKRAKNAVAPGESEPVPEEEATPA